jgi:hypothetical protein
MSRSFISEQQIEANFEWLEKHADVAAKARAHRIYLEEYRKSIKALLMKEDVNKPISAQERDAYADKRYQTHLKAIEAAVFEDERLRWMKEKKLAEVEAWRTASSNKRHQI